MIFQSIPSPGQGVWHLGPLPVRAYALAIICGILVAWAVLTRRYRAKGGPTELLPDMVVVMVIAGIVGGRLYHVITDYDLYFGEGRDPVSALYVWKGGLGIWGAVTLGGLGAYLMCRHYGLRAGPFGDALAPGLFLAQAIGRFGNYFNQELFGSPTTLPWGLEIDDAHLPAGFASGTLFHPTFLYESIWNLSMAALIAWADRKFRFKSGQVFALYLFAYPVGRIWMETMRLDAARTFLGIRLNAWTSMGMIVVGLILFLVAGRLGRSTSLVGAERFGEPAAGADSASLDEDAAPSSIPAGEGTATKEAATDSPDVGNARADERDGIIHADRGPSEPLGPSSGR